MSPAKPRAKKPAAAKPGPAARSPAAEPSAPLYQQVVAVLRAEILDGTYPVGSKLPTEDVLTQRFGVTRFLECIAQFVVKLLDLFSLRLRFIRSAACIRR